MYIGCLGDVAFEVNSDAVRTVTSLESSSSGRWSEHALAGGSTLSEYTGREPDEISINILLSEYLGADPEEDYETLWRYTRQGTVVDFCIGDKFYTHRWIVKSLKCSATYFDKHGGITSMNVSVSLKEYF